MGAAVKRSRIEESNPVPRTESYVVHIYRREGSGPGMRVAGLLEKVGNGKQQPFSSGEELWSLLNAAPKAWRKTGGQRGKAERKASR